MVYQIKWYIKYNVKTNLVEERQWYYWNYILRDKGVLTFASSMSLKVSVIARVEFELTYFETAVQPLRHRDSC